MKKCPFCAEEIQDDAVKCRFCNEFLDAVQPPQTPKVKWFFKTPSLVINFLLFGPLVLPLVWFHPKYSPLTKLIITVIVLLITWWTVHVVSGSVKSILGYYSQLAPPAY